MSNSSKTNIISINTTGWMNATSIIRMIRLGFDEHNIEKDKDLQIEFVNRLGDKKFDVVSLKDVQMIEINNKYVNKDTYLKLIAQGLANLIVNQYDDLLLRLKQLAIRIANKETALDRTYVSTMLNVYDITHELKYAFNSYVTTKLCDLVTEYEVDDNKKKLGISYTSKLMLSNKFKKAKEPEDKLHIINKIITTDFNLISKQEKQDIIFKFMQVEGNKKYELWMKYEALLLNLLGILYSDVDIVVDPDKKIKEDDDIVNLYLELLSVRGEMIKSLKV